MTPKRRSTRSKKLVEKPVEKPIESKKIQEQRALIFNSEDEVRFAALGLSLAFMQTVSPIGPKATMGDVHKHVEMLALAHRTLIEITSRLGVDSAQAIVRRLNQLADFSKGDA